MIVLRPLIRPRPIRPGDLGHALRHALGLAKARRTRATLAGRGEPTTGTHAEREADRHG